MLNRTRCARLGRRLVARLTYTVSDRAVVCLACLDRPSRSPNRVAFDGAAESSQANDTGIDYHSRNLETLACPGSRVRGMGGEATSIGSERCSGGAQAIWPPLQPHEQRLLSAC